MAGATALFSCLCVLVTIQNFFVRFVDLYINHVTIYKNESGFFVDAVQLLCDICSVLFSLLLVYVARVYNKRLLLYRILMVQIGLAVLLITYDAIPPYKSLNFDTTNFIIKRLIDVIHFSYSTLVIVWQLLNNLASLACVIYGFSYLDDQISNKKACLKIGIILISSNVGTFVADVCFYTTHVAAVFFFSWVAVTVLGLIIFMIMYIKNGVLNDRFKKFDHLTTNCPEFLTSLKTILTNTVFMINILVASLASAAIDNLDMLGDAYTRSKFSVSTNNERMIIESSGYDLLFGLLKPVIVGLVMLFSVCCQCKVRTKLKAMFMSQCIVLSIGIAVYCQISWMNCNSSLNDVHGRCSGMWFTPFVIYKLLRCAYDMIYKASAIDNILFAMWTVREKDKLTALAVLMAMGKFWNIGGKFLYTGILHLICTVRDENSYCQLFTADTWYSDVFGLITASVLFITFCLSLILYIRADPNEYLYKEEDEVNLETVEPDSEHAVKRLVPRRRKQMNIASYAILRSYKRDSWIRILRNLSLKRLNWTTISERIAKKKAAREERAISRLNSTPMCGSNPVEAKSLLKEACFRRANTLPGFRKNKFALRRNKSCSGCSSEISFPRSSPVKTVLYKSDSTNKPPLQKAHSFHEQISVETDARQTKNGKVRLVPDRSLDNFGYSKETSFANNLKNQTDGIGERKESSKLCTKSVISCIVVSEEEISNVESNSEPMSSKSNLNFPLRKSRSFHREIPKKAVADARQMDRGDFEGAPGTSRKIFLGRSNSFDSYKGASFENDSNKLPSFKLRSKSKSFCDDNLNEVCSLIQSNSFHGYSEENEEISDVELNNGRMENEELEDVFESAGVESPLYGYSKENKDEENSGRMGNEEFVPVFESAGVESPLYGYSKENEDEEISDTELNSGRMGNEDLDAVCESPEVESALYESHLTKQFPVMTVTDIRQESSESSGQGFPPSPIQNPKVTGLNPPQPTVEIV